MIDSLFQLIKKAHLMQTALICIYNRILFSTEKLPLFTLKALKPVKIRQLYYFLLVNWDLTSTFILASASLYVHSRLEAPCPGIDKKTRLEVDSHSILMRLRSNRINIYLREWMTPRMRWSPTKSCWKGRFLRGGSRETGALLLTRCTTDKRPPLSAW